MCPLCQLEKRCHCGLLAPSVSPLHHFNVEHIWFRFLFCYLYIEMTPAKMTFRCKTFNLHSRIFTEKTQTLSAFCLSLQSDAASCKSLCTENLGPSSPNFSVVRWASTWAVRHSRCDSVINVMLHANIIPSALSPFSGEHTPANGEHGHCFPHLEFIWFALPSALQVYSYSFHSM